MRRTSRGLLYFLSFFIFVGVVIAVPKAAGQANARLAGSVKDNSGGSVAGAAVTLTNQTTNISRSTKTDADGNYLFSLVEIGAFTVTVDHPGFKKKVQTGITLELNQNGRLDVALEVGKETETIEVSTTIAQVDTTGATLGKVESTKRIQDLPLVERDTLQLGLLQAGVFTPDVNDGSGNPFNVSGQRSESLTFLIDGADNTDFLNNNIVVSPNPDAVAEFKILTNNYDAEFGRSSGGIINQVIKSGTNSLHGTLFEFLRNDVFNARDFFLPAPLPKGTFKRNVFGGTVGAPIIKDKTFVFAAYQGARRREGQTSQQLTVLSSAERTGNFGELLTGSPVCPNPTGADPTYDSGQLFVPGTTSIVTCRHTDGLGNSVSATTGTPYANNIVPVNPISAAYIAKYLPLPLPGTDGTSNAYLFSSAAAIDDDQGIVRVDHSFSSRDSLSAVYLIDDLRDAYPFINTKGASTGGTLPLGSAFADTVRSQNLSFTWTHTFARGWINEARISANRTATLQAIPRDTTSPQALGFTNINPDDPRGTSLPILYASGFNIGPSPQGPTKEHNMVFQEQDHVTIPHGRHEWKFGADLRRIQNNFNYDFYNNGSYDFGLYGDGSTTNGSMTGNSFADFVGGFPDNYYQSSNAVYGIRSTSQYYYGQDTFKIRPRLTLVLGVRYEYNSPLSDIHNNIIGYFGPGAQSKVFPGAPPGILYPGDPGTPNSALVYPDKNNWAPRFGFAWDMFGTGKLVMRGGFGIFYDIQDGGSNLQFGGQPPYGYIANFLYFSSSFNIPDPLNPPNFLADPFALNGSQNVYPYRAGGHVGQFFVPAITYAAVTDPHFRTPYSENYNFGFQYQVEKNTALEVVYVGSLGRKLISSQDLNPPQPSIERAQLANLIGGFVNPDCARALGGCQDPTDPNESFTGISQLIATRSTGLSDSHQLQVTLDRRYSHGISFRLAYTLAKTIDLTSGFRARSATYTDPFNPRLDRGLADFDVHNRVVFSGSWELPLDKPFQHHRFLKKVTEAWQANAIATFQGGSPFTLYSRAGQSYQANQLDRVDLVGKITTFDPRQQRTFTADCIGGTATGNFWFDPTAFNCTSIAPFTFGTLGRNVIRGPGINNWDISFLKHIKLSESRSLEFRAEMFNAFNHAQFYNPDTNGSSTTFGQITQTREPPRLVQFALKFYY